MDVYVVLLDMGYDGMEIQSVFSTLGAAEGELHRLQREYGPFTSPSDTYVVQPFVLDQHVPERTTQP